GPGRDIAWNCLMSVVAIVYSVTMHARSGQTVGKRALSVILLNVGESRVPTWREAVLRDIGEIAPAAVLAGFVAAAMVNGDYELDPAKYAVLVGSLNIVTGAWTL